MSKYQVDRDTNYMYQMWGTTKLITDYWTQPQITEDPEEILVSEHHNFKKQTELHEIIRNDDDYDDWEYGTEPCYGKKG